MISRQLRKQTLSYSYLHCNFGFSYITYPCLDIYTRVKPWLQLRFRLRSDYDVSRAPASNSTQAKKWTMSIFPRSHVAVVSQSNRTQIVISITSVVVECVVASSYRSRIVVESQLWYRLNAMITIAIRLRYDYDPTTTYRARLVLIRHKQKMNMSIFVIVMS